MSVFGNIEKRGIYGEQSSGNENFQQGGPGLTGFPRITYDCWELYYWSFILKKGGLIGVDLPGIRAGGTYTATDIEILKICDCVLQGGAPPDPQGEGGTTDVWPDLTISSLPDLFFGGSDHMSGWARNNTKEPCDKSRALQGPGDPYVPPIGPCPCDGFKRYKLRNIGPLEEGPMLNALNEQIGSALLKSGWRDPCCDLGYQP